MSNSTKGFSLIELIVTLAVASVVIALALPSFQRLMQSNRVAAIGDEFSSALTFARMEALKRSQRVSICASDDGVACTADWNDGYIVFVDTAASDTAAPTPAAAPAVSALKKWGPRNDGVSLTAKLDGVTDTNYIRFTSLGGFARPATGETRVEVDVLIPNCSGINLPRITVGLTGMVSSVDRNCP